MSDGTVLLGVIAVGTKLTLTICEELRKPYLVNPTADAFRKWLIDHKVKVLNVARSRGGDLSTEQTDEYRKLMIDTLSEVTSVAFVTYDKPLYK